MATAPVVDLQRFARAIRARVAGANIVGATLVFLYFGLFPSTGVTGGARGMHTTIVSLVTFGAYMAFTGLIAFNYGPRTGRAALSWLFEGRLPTPAEREVALREPWRNSVWPFSAWAGAAVVFGPILQWNLHNPATQSLRVAVVVLLGGLTTCSLTFLLLGRVFRPIFAIALAGEPPERPLTLGVRPRLLLSWALGSAVPLIALGTAPIGLDAHKRAQLTAPLVFLSLLGLFVGGVAVYLAARTVADPLEGVRAALGLVGAGQLDVVLPVDDAGEVGLVQAGFNHMATGLREREHLRDLFGRHVGVEVARQALEGDAGLRGEQREATALFVDLIGSTSLAQSRPPEDVVAVLNALFAAVVGAVGAEGGWVNKFEGDGALCIFGAPDAQPDHAARALRSARSLRATLAQLDDVDVGIGVSAGVVVAGNVGAEQRYEYTVIGDPVNEAARLTDEAKRQPGRVLAGESAVRIAGDEASHWSRAGTVLLRGRSAPTTVYAPS